MACFDLCCCAHGQVFGHSAEQAAAEACGAAAPAGASASVALGGPTHRPEVFDTLCRPLLAAWAAAPAFTPPPAATQMSPESSASEPSAAQTSPESLATEPAAAQALDLLRHGAEALAALPHVHPQLGNLLVRCYRGSSILRHFDALTPPFLLFLRLECGSTAWVASLVCNTDLAVYTQDSGTILRTVGATFMDCCSACVMSVHQDLLSRSNLLTSFHFHC